MRPRDCSGAVRSRAKTGSPRHYPKAQPSINTLRTSAALYGKVTMQPGSGKDCRGAFPISGTWRWRTQQNLLGDCRTQQCDIGLGAMTAPQALNPCTLCPTFMPCTKAPDPQPPLMLCSKALCMLPESRMRGAPTPETFQSQHHQNPHNNPKP